MQRAAPCRPRRLAPTTQRVGGERLFQRLQGCLLAPALPKLQRAQEQTKQRRRQRRCPRQSFPGPRFHSQPVFASPLQRAALRVQSVLRTPGRALAPPPPLPTSTAARRCTEGPPESLQPRQHDASCCEATSRPSLPRPRARHLPPKNEPRNHCAPAPEPVWHPAPPVPPPRRCKLAGAPRRQPPAAACHRQPRLPLQSAGPRAAARAKAASRRTPPWQAPRRRTGCRRFESLSARRHECQAGPRTPPADREPTPSRRRQ